MPMNFFVETVTTTTTAESNYQSVNDFWLFVIYCFVVIVVVIFFSFYFNRVLGQLVTLIVNQYTWRKHNAFIEVESIRVSLLGGRLLFKNLRYFSTNQSVSILKGHIAFRYWIFHVRKSEVVKNGPTSDFPCRIACSVEGLEWFFYNNVPAYNKVRDILGLSSEDGSVSDKSSAKSEKNDTIDIEKVTNVDKSLMQRLLPVQFECVTGSLMIGNTKVKSMLVCKTDQVSGIYRVTNSRSTLDYYKSVLEIVLKKTQINYKENMDFETVNNTRTEVIASTKQITLLDILLEPFKNIYPFTKPRQFGEMQHFHNLMKEERNININESNTTYHEEYARVVNVLECTTLSLEYYADYAGPVPSKEDAGAYFGLGPDIGNNGLPPEWGVKIHILDAVFHYGPWTDMQRSEMQDYFFPSSHRKNIPTKHLVPGQQRVATAFETYIEFMNECNLRIPTREASKDWKYAAGTAELDIGSDEYYTRPYGWLNIKANEGSFIKIITPYVCGPEGYKSLLDIVLMGADITTSVNYASFIQMNRINIHVDMPTPLDWNGYRQWDFKITANNPTMFLLRDHIYLVQDLLKDWNSSPPPDILHFTPITYQLQLSLNNPIFYLCVNEHNIIRYPNSIEDNAYFKLQSQHISVNVAFPFIEYQPETTCIKFFVDATHISANLSLQTSHTFCSFMREEDASAAVLVNMTIDGTYEYYSTVDILRHIESCNLNVKINGATIKLFGTLIRYLFILRDNYFGEWDNFLTIEEYRKQRNNPLEWRELKKRKMESKPIADPFEVYVLLELEDGVMLLPENLYECSSYSQFEFQQLQAEVRNLDVYLDMYLNISPITLSRNISSALHSKEGFFRIKNERDPQNYIYIDGNSQTNISYFQLPTEDMIVIGFNAYAHRLFGPLPECATYLCHWEFDLGHITGEIKPSFLLGLACFGQTFAYNLIDEDNAVPQEMKAKELPDVSFVKLYIREVDICLMGTSSATNFCLKEGILLEFDNLINSKYSQRITIKIPTISTCFLANPDKARATESDKENEYPWIEVAKTDLGLSITIFRHTALWKKARQEQQNFLRSQDYPTRRCVRLYEESDKFPQSSASPSRSVSDHHVGLLYAPPFRPFMFGRVEDKSVSYDLKNYKVNTPVSERSSYMIYSISDLTLSDEESFLSGSEYEDFKFDNDSYSGHSFHSHGSAYAESFHTANNSNHEYYENTLDSGSFEDCFYSSGDSSDYSNENEINSSLRECDPKKSSKPEKAAIPPSIPYKEYLRRFKIERPYCHGDNEFFHPNFPPTHPQFIPEKILDQQRQKVHEGTDSGSFKEKNHDDIYNNHEADPDDSFGKGNEVVATMVIEATQPVIVLVTPIIIKVIQEQAEEIAGNDWDLESMMDALQMNYIEQLTRFLTNQYICTRFAVILPQVYLRCIQNVIIPDELPSYKHGETFVKTPYNLEDAVLCSGDIFLNNFKMSGSVKFEDYAYEEKMDKVAESNLKLQELRLHINVDNMGSTVRYVSKQYDRRAFSFGIPYECLKNRNSYTELDENNTLTNELTVLDFVITEFSFKMLGARTPNYLEMKIANIDSIIVTESIEILVGAVYSWLVFVDDLKGILKGFQDRRSKQIQIFINEIAIFSNTQGVVNDPIFLTAPSTMLRLGSRNFRNDCGWKLLAHMRHCLRLMSLHNREELQYTLTVGSSLQGIKSNEMFDNTVEIFSHWRSWEVNYNDVKQCRLFTQPFKKTTSEQEKDKNSNITNEIVKLLMTSSNFAKIRLGVFKFTIFEEETTSLYKMENSILVGPLDFSVECLFKKSIISKPHDNHFTDSAQQNQTAVDGYLDIITRINLGRVTISVNPIIMAFARHMILVQRVFTNKMLNLENTIEVTNIEDKITKNLASSSITSSSHNTTPNQDLDMDVLLGKIDIVGQALLNLDKIEITAHAQDLKMDANINGLQGSALFSNPKLAPLQLSAHADHDSETTSNKRSSTRGRRIAQSGPRLILEATCVLKTTNVIFCEELNINSEMRSNTLLGIGLNGTSINTNLSQVVKSSKRHLKNPSTKDILSVFLNIHKVHIHMPQSLLKLYGFVESWQSQQGSRFHFLFQNLVREWEEQRRENMGFSRPSSLVFNDIPYTNNMMPATNSANTKKLDIKLQFLLNTFLIQADLLPSLSVEYEILSLFLMVDKIQHKSAHVYSYTFQLSKQIIYLITQDATKPNIETVINENRNTFSVPGIRSTGSLKSDYTNESTTTDLQSMISIDVISMSLDVSLIDSLLTTQSLLGNEISDLVEVISFTKPKKTQNKTSTNKSHKPPSRTLNYIIDISLDGVNVSATSPSAIGSFRSNVLEASISNDSSSSQKYLGSSDKLIWRLNAENFSLSLDINTAERARKGSNLVDPSYRRNCLAYILVSVSIQNYLPLCTDNSCEKNTHLHNSDKTLDSLYVNFSRIQTVMQPIALGKLAEIYIYYDTELRKKKMMKKDEIDRLSANTKRIVQTISSRNNWPKALQEEPGSLLEGRILNLLIQHVGIAIPLDAQSNLPFCDSNNGNGALLLTVGLIEFLTKNIEKNAMRLENTALQFVEKFDQSNTEHFMAEKHPQMNQIRFPLIKCQVSATNEKHFQAVIIDAHINGFEIEIDGNIAKNINTLNDIYAACKDRVNALTSKANFGTKSTPPSPTTAATTSTETNSSEAGHDFEIVKLDINCKLTCESGNIRMYLKKQSNGVYKNRKRSASLRNPPEMTERSLVAITIPGLSAWVTYQTSLGAHATSSGIPKRFHGDILILESENIIHPALLQFLHDVVASIKPGVQQSSEQKAIGGPATLTESNMSVSIFLRLSKTQLNLTCEPISKVACSLSWQDSELLISLSSDGTTPRSIGCVGSVCEIASVIKHHFSPEPCLNARINRVLFSASLTSQRQDNCSEDNISVVLDIPDIQGDLNMRHLQDLLILKSCWSTRDKVTEAYTKSGSNTPKQSTFLTGRETTLSLPNISEMYHAAPALSSTSAPFSKHIALLIRNINFSVDLSQHIGNIAFILTSLSVQMHHIPFRTKKLNLALKDFKMTSEGRLSGDALFKPIVVEYRIDQSLYEGHHREKAFLCSRSDGFTAAFQYEYQNIIDIIQHALEFNVDYRRISNMYELQSSGNLEALVARLSIKTVPVIITIAQMLKDLVQKKLVEAGLQPNLENKKTEGQKGEKKYKNSSVQSETQFSVDAIEVIIYPSQFQDSDNIHMRARDFKICMEELPRSMTGVHRKLKIKIKNAALAKNVPGKELLALYQGSWTKKSFSKTKNMGGIKIFGMPETHLLMESTELDRHIDYLFNTVFAGRVNVSLNIGLMKYLQEMVNMFNTQLNRALNKHGHKDTTSDGETSQTSRASLNEPEEQSGSGSASNFTYHAISPINFQPQLQVMGDATPPLEWLGLNREKIPELVHENLTVHLDKLVETIWDILETQAD